MKTCPYCAEDIQEAAVVCKHCGRDLQKPPTPAHPQVSTDEKKKTSPAAWGCLTLVVLIGMGWCASIISPTPTPSSSGSSSSGAQPASTTDPDLAILASSGTIGEHGYNTVQGQVSNISGRSISNVQAVVNWYDASGGFITSDTALVEYNPLLSGQTSPFKVMTRANPAMKKFDVAFKRLGGRSLEVRDDTKRAESTGGKDYQKNDVPTFRPLVRTGREVAVRVTTSQLNDDSALWRIARFYQRDFAQVTGDGSVTVMFWTDQRFEPTALPPTTEQLAHRRAVIVIDKKTNKERLER